MKRLSSALLIVCAAALASPAIAAETSTVVTTQAIVQAIDYGSRIVVLRGPMGGTAHIRVAESVPNLDRVQPGDRVKVAHTEAVAVELERSDRSPSAAVVRTFETPVAGGRPRAEASSTVYATAKVKSIDRDARTLTITGPAGHDVTINVGPALRDEFARVNRGDMVAIQYHEALAYSLQPG
ncbi:MAG TPA: hypothetical protein VLW45_00140 [Pelomicrobium sp.]|nr:hypothetical protein [Pelomicrobium sp.]